MSQIELGSPFEDGETSAEIDSSNGLESELNNIINEHGLIAVLESLKELVKAKAEVQRIEEQAEAFEDVARALTVLIKALPAELDIEIALGQITHTSRDIEPESVSQNVY